MHKSDSPPAYLLVTFLVTHDGELGHPMDTIVKRVDLTTDGQPVAIARLTEAIVREIARKARVGQEDDDRCPVGDPDCMYGDGHCHDACEPAEVPDAP